VQNYTVKYAVCGYCVITFQLHPVHLCCGCKVPWRRPAELLYAVLSRKAAAAGWNMRTLIQKQQVRLITMRVIIYAVASRQSNVASHREQSYQLLRGNLTLQDKQGARGEHGNNVDYEYCFHNEYAIVNHLAFCHRRSHDHLWESKWGRPWKRRRLKVVTERNGEGRMCATLLVFRNTPETMSMHI